MAAEIIRGCWQLAGGHGAIDTEAALLDMEEYVLSGICTFDVGDIYGDAEVMLGKFVLKMRSKYGKKFANRIKIHTKFVPDLNALDDLNELDIRSIINRSLERMNIDQLELVQFHWWDLQKGNYIEALKILEKLKLEGLIRKIGLTNFDKKEVVEILAAGIDGYSNQIQVLLLDPRGFNGTIQFCRNNKIKIFAYGVLAGGLLTENYKIASATNRSVIKYSYIIRHTGEDKYNQIIETITRNSAILNMTASELVLAYFMQHSQVDAVIVGVSKSGHACSLLSARYIKIGKSKNDLDKLYYGIQSKIKDSVYGWERDPEGEEAKIMQYNNNKMRG
jgi:aryl-alcohol dehydrogenase-like predicted oxidoreductase